MVKVFVGHDWAEAHHDVHIEDGKGSRLAKAVGCRKGVEGVARFHELVGPIVDEPAEVDDGDRDGPGLVHRGVGRGRISRCSR